MRKSILTLSLGVAAAMMATAASAQTSTSPTGPAFSQRFFTTALANDPSRDVQMQMQLHLPNRPGNGFHSHNGDQWEVVLDGEITFTVKGEAAARAQDGRIRLHSARHDPPQRKQERSADAHHRAPDQGQGQAAEHSRAGELKLANAVARVERNAKPGGGALSLDRDAAPGFRVPLNPGYEAAATPLPSRLRRDRRP